MSVPLYKVISGVNTPLYNPSLMLPIYDSGSGCGCGCTCIDGHPVCADGTTPVCADGSVPTCSGGVCVCGDGSTPQYDAIASACATCITGTTHLEYLIAFGFVSSGGPGCQCTRYNNSSVTVRQIPSSCCWGIEFFDTSGCDVTISFCADAGFPHGGTACFDLTLGINDLVNGHSFQAKWQLCPVIGVITMNCGTHILPFTTWTSDTGGTLPCVSNGPPFPDPVTITALGVGV